jgi:hypothetical protein
VSENWEEDDPDLAEAMRRWEEMQAAPATPRPTTTPWRWWSPLTRPLHRSERAWAWGWGLRIEQWLDKENATARSFCGHGWHCTASIRDRWCITCGEPLKRAKKMEEE